MRGSPVPANWKSKTPDGRLICYAFNNPREKCAGGCGKVHCCQICLEKHPVHSCPHNRARPSPLKGGGAAAVAAAADGAALAVAGADGVAR